MMLFKQGNAVMKYIMGSLVIGTMVMLSGCGGSSDGSSENANTSSNALLVSGRVNDYQFSIPCDQLDFNVVQSSKSGIDYVYQSATSQSTGIFFQVVVPTKSSLFKNKLGKYGTSAVGNFSPISGSQADAKDQFKIGMKIPRGTAETGERFYSLDSEPTDAFYSELVSVVEKSKSAGQTNMIVTFKYRLPASYIKAGITQPNTSIEDGLIRLEFAVADQ